LLPNPHLIDGKKWDLRTYVLVTSVVPLRAYIYKRGLVRFAGQAYDAKAKRGGGREAFLTNTSVNKKGGVKMADITTTFAKLKDRLKALGQDGEALFHAVGRAIAMTLLAAEPTFARLYGEDPVGTKRGCKGAACHHNSYHLLGVDLLVDTLGVPRVIEVNGSPNMWRVGKPSADYVVTKNRMTEDLVRLVYGPKERSLPYARREVNRALRNTTAYWSAEEATRAFVHVPEDRAEVGAEATNATLGDDDEDGSEKGSEKGSTIGGDNDNGNSTLKDPLFAWKGRRSRRLREYLVTTRQEEMNFGGWYRLYPVPAGTTARGYRHFLAHMVEQTRIRRRIARPARNAMSAWADAGEDARLVLHDMATALETARYRKCVASRRGCKPNDFTSVVDYDE